LVGGAGAGIRGLLDHDGAFDDEIPDVLVGVIDHRLLGLLRDARGLAEVLGFFAGQLLGGPYDLDGPPLDRPTRSGVLAALRRIDGARSGLERQGQRLSGDEREALPSPDALRGEG
jgi:hypothetical protein